MLCVVNTHSSIEPPMEYCVSAPNDNTSLWVACFDGFEFESLIGEVKIKRDQKSNSFEMPTFYPTLHKHFFTKSFQSFSLFFNFRRWKKLPSNSLQSNPSKHSDTFTRFLSMNNLYRTISIFCISAWTMHVSITNILSTVLAMTKFYTWICSWIVDDNH